MDPASQESETFSNLFAYRKWESQIALKQLGFGDFKDVLPGQAIIIEKGNKPIARQIQEPLRYAVDIFEFCYFVRGPFPKLYPSSLCA